MGFLEKGEKGITTQLENIFYDSGNAVLELL